MADDWDFDELYANTWTEEDRRAHADQPVSTKRLPVAWGLALLLGPVGAAWFYLGRPAVGAAKLVLAAAGVVLLLTLERAVLGQTLLALAAAWAVIDLFMLLAGALRDRDGRRLAGHSRWAGPCAALTVLLLVGLLVVGMILGGIGAVSG